MIVLEDFNKRSIRLTDERQQHLESMYPDMKGQVRRIDQTLASPDKVVRSKTDSLVELFYKFYRSTPVTEKYLCRSKELRKRSLYYHQLTSLTA
jgi:hypothetical protein